MPKSLRQIASEMDPLVDRHSGVQLSTVLNQHRWPTGFPSSSRGFKEVERRHSDSSSIRFLTYNTFLLEADFKMPDPFPDIRISAKPALHERAREIGQRIFHDYDFASLYEVMQLQQRDEILANFDPTLPDSFFGGELTSLFTISSKFKIGRREVREYSSKGKVTGVDIVPGIGPSVDVSFDSDFYAHKGVMLTEIITPHGTLEVYSTHLFFGGGVPSEIKDAINAVTPFEAHISESDPDERFATQLNEINELIAFFHDQHKDHEQNVAIICGDFNIDGSDPLKFGPLKSKLASIGFKDAWAEGPFSNKLKGGQTTRNDDDDKHPIELNFNNVCTELPGSTEFCDDTVEPGHPPEPDSVGRFDYIFVQEPQEHHTAIVDLARIRRREFRHDASTGDQHFLSDHLGLETVLFVTRKP
jgi:endonuclease/exonuclease/phosphatase family metal-dependent hydrolase